MTTSLLEALQPVLNTLAAGGAFYATNPTQPQPTDANGYPLPYIIYLDIVSVDNVSLQGASNVQTTRIQVDIFAPYPLTTQSIRAACDSALYTAFQAVPLSSRGEYEDTVKLYRVIREYSIAYDESAT